MIGFTFDTVRLDGTRDLRLRDRGELLQKPGTLVELIDRVNQAAHEGARDPALNRHRTSTRRVTLSVVLVGIAPTSIGLRIIFELI